MKRWYGTLGIGLTLVWGLVFFMTGMPQVQAQTAPNGGAASRGVYLPFISVSPPIPTPTPTPTPVPVPVTPRIKQKSGIHMGNRGIGTDWPVAAFKLITGTAQGIFPAATVVQSSQLFDFHRSTAPPCRIDAVKQVRAHNLYDYLRMAIQHGTIVVIRITPSPGNFTDYNDLGDHHILLSDTSLPGADYCDPKNAEKFRDIADVANEMQAIYNWLMAQAWFKQGGYQNQIYFEPANEPNQEWYQEKVVEANKHKKTLIPGADNKDAWIAMDDYFTNLYQLAKRSQPALLILAPPMAQELYGETFRLESCNRIIVHDEGNSHPVKSGYDFMEKTYDGGTFDGYSWHNYWQETHEQWEGQDIENNCTSPLGSTVPTNDHVYEYFPHSMQQNINWSLKPRFITEADLKSPCHSINPLTSKIVFPERTSHSLQTFFNAEESADYIVAWLLIQEDPGGENCKNGENDDKNYEINWHEAYQENGTSVNGLTWFQQWWLSDKP